MNILLAAILVVNVMFLAILIVVFLKTRTIYRNFVDFITPAKENEPSQFAELISRISDTFARSIMAQAKAILMGKASGEARGEAANEAEVGQALLAQSNPLLAGLAGMLPPKIRKTLLRNPQLIDAALARFGKPQATISPGNGKASQMDFKI